MLDPWGKFTPDLTFNACMKVARNFVTPEQIATSRPTQDINADLMMIMEKLS